MSRERCRFAGDPFHHVAVATEGVDVVVEDREIRPVEMLGQPAARDRHADAVAASLTQGTGGGFHAGGAAKFGMTRTAAIQLAKALYVFQVHRRLIGELAAFAYGFHAGEM